MQEAARRMASAVTLCTALMAGGYASAQSEFRPVGNERDWFVYAESIGGNRTCWVASVPQSWVARRGGRDVTRDVSRGEIRLMAARRSGQSGAPEVSVAVGYPFRDGSNAQLQIGNETFQLFTQGDMAWTEDAAADARVVAAMRAGAEARVTGVSSRGTQTVDTYSLMGFTAALEQAQQLCQ